MRMSSAGSELVFHIVCVPCRDSHGLVDIHIESNELTAAALFHTFVWFFFTCAFDTTGADFIHKSSNAGFWLLWILVNCCDTHITQLTGAAI